MRSRSKVTRAQFTPSISWPPPLLQLSADEVGELSQAELAKHRSCSVNYAIAVDLVRSSWAANMRLIETTPNCWTRRNYLRPHIGLPPTWEAEIMLHVSQSTEYLQLIIRRLEVVLDDVPVTAPVLQQFVEAVLRDDLLEHQYTLEWNGKVLYIIRPSDTTPPTAA